jgi:hypothetical protein
MTMWRLATRSLSRTSLNARSLLDQKHPHTCGFHTIVLHPLYYYCNQYIQNLLSNFLSLIREIWMFKFTAQPQRVNFSLQRSVRASPAGRPISDSQSVRIGPFGSDPGQKRPPVRHLSVWVGRCIQRRDPFSGQG